MDKLVIYGAGGFGKEVKSMLPHIQKKFDLIGYLDDGVSKGTGVQGIKVLGGCDESQFLPEGVNIIIALGNPRSKAVVAHKLSAIRKFIFPSLIHRQSHLQDSSAIILGEGCIIGAGSVMTTEIKIGNHALINLNVTIGHGTEVGDFSSVMPGVNLSGGVKIGKEVLIGTGASIINNINVGDFSIIGAGSVVNHHVPESRTAVGVPARVIK